MLSICIYVCVPVCLGVVFGETADACCVCDFLMWCDMHYIRLKTCLHIPMLCHLCMDAFCVCDFLMWSEIYYTRLETCIHIPMLLAICVLPRLQYLLGAMREHTRTWRREHAELERQHLGKQNVLIKCIRYWQVCAGVCVCRGDAEMFEMLEY